LLHGTTFETVQLALPFRQKKRFEGYTEKILLFFYFDENKDSERCKDSLDIKGSYYCKTTHFTDFIAGIIKILSLQNFGLHTYKYQGFKSGLSPLVGIQSVPAVEEERRVRFWHCNSSSEAGCIV
jgi:hypothetical protein